MLAEIDFSKEYALEYQNTIKMYMKKRLMFVLFLFTSHLWLTLW
jgi:hypothetical protein